MKLCIVGSGRCGSNLLGTTFHSHPGLAVFNESHWLPKMYEMYGLRRVPWRELLRIAEKTTWVGGERLLEVNLQQSDHSDYSSFYSELNFRLSRAGTVDIREFSDILVETLFGKNIEWGDKTPDYGYYLQVLHELWPDCKFIHLIRRPLAVASSMSKHPGFKLMVSSGHDNWCPLSYDRLYESLEPGEPGINEYLLYWRRRVSRIRDEAKRVPAQLYKEIWYEDLLSHPVEKLSELADYVGVEQDKDWLHSFAQRVDASRASAHITS